MIKEIQYCVDEKGKKVSVIVPFKDWETITKQNTKLQAKLNFISGINEALAEVKQARKAGQVLPTLAEFINESRS
jgi:transcriptional regulator of met regulon